LIVDDDPGFLLGLAELVRREASFVATAGLPLKQARAEIASSLPDILLVDLRLPDGSGLDLLDGLEPTTAPEVIFDHGQRQRRDRSGCAAPRRYGLLDEARRFRPVSRWRWPT